MLMNWLQAFIKPTIKKLKASELNDFKRRHVDAIFLDIREESEARDEGLFPGAVRSVWNTQAFDLTMRRFPKARPIVVLCQAGKRSQMAAEKMALFGFKKVYVVEGGLSAWLLLRKRMGQSAPTLGTSAAAVV